MFQEGDRLVQTGVGAQEILAIQLCRGQPLRCPGHVLLRGLGVQGRGI